MTTERIPLTLAFVLAMVACASPAAARAAQGHVFYGVGWRQSVAADAGGVDFRLGLGVSLGPLGIDYVAEHTTDATFKPVDRTYGRGTNWLALSVRIPLTSRLSLAFGGGPGLGWIKPPGQADAPARQMSAGVHEFVRLDIWGSNNDDVGLLWSIRVEPQHLWQDTILPGVDHGIAVWMSMGLAFADH